jgi:hypothetical protein
MALNFGEGFNILNRDPIDSRTAVGTIAERDGLDYFTLFEGLITYVSESGKTFVLTATGSGQGSGQVWEEVGGDLQTVLTAGNSSSLDFSASVANVEEVSFIGSSEITIKLKSHPTENYLVVSGSGLVLQEATGSSLPTPKLGALVYQSSSFYAGIEP